MIVLDTHAWVWWVSAPDRLSSVAREAIDRAERVGICTISCWEVTMLVIRGRLRLSLETELWVRRGLAHPRAVELPLSSEVAVRAALLRSEGLQSDPADEIIYATARANGSPLVTRDAALREFDPRATVW